MKVLESLPTEAVAAIAIAVPVLIVPAFIAAVIRIQEFFTSDRKQ